VDNVPSKIENEPGNVRVIERTSNAPKVYRVSGLAAVLLGLPVIIFMGLTVGLIFLLLLCTLPFFIFSGIRRVQNSARNRFNDVYSRTPVIDSEHLPKHARTSGYVVHDVFQCPGAVEYREGELIIEPSVGEPNTIQIDEIDSFRIGPNINGSYFPGYKGVMLCVNGRWNTGFTVTEIEPWRSILSGTAKDATLDESVRVEKV
jgi:hypothetical protein